uniref:Uncharacterized protein n=1 Tax=Zooxanthella nutricula TaxID=1333877 RepID=A0A7S2NY77_9DINO
MMEETFVWMVVVAWYTTHHVPFVSDGLTIAMSTGPLKLLFSLFFSIFKTQQIVGAVELAAKAVAAEDLLPHSAYFPVAIAPCLLCGFLGGCGGAFLPLSTGLKPIEEGRVWNVRAAFFAPCIYVAATRYFGCDLLDAKMGICLFRLLGEVFPGPRDAALAPVTAALYASTRVRSSVVVPVAKDFSLGA